MAREHISTKTPGVTQSFDLNSPSGRHEYFQAKIGNEVEAIKGYLDEGNTFVSFWLAKKQAGKGTYSKMLIELLGEDRVAHISVGDLVRHTHSYMSSSNGFRELQAFFDEHYRGSIGIQEGFDALLGRNTTTLLPTEFILTLVKKEILSIGNKAILLDGFPRGLDQISYSLYFREIMNLREDPDFFVLIDVPDSVLDARMKARVVCPTCQLSRSTKFLPTEKIEYDPKDDAYYLLCDNPACPDKGIRLQGKEGDEFGIESIRDRLEADGALIEYAKKLQGIDKVVLQNTVQVAEADSLVDPYEITPEYTYTQVDDGSVVLDTKQWVVIDSEGKDSYSLVAAPVVVSLIKQIHSIINL